jgi:hypothetical protein
LPGIVWTVTLPGVPAAAPLEALEVEGLPGAVWTVTLPGVPATAPLEALEVEGVPGGVWTVMLPGVPAAAPLEALEVEGVPGVAWMVTLPGVPGVTPPEVTGAPGRVEVPGLGGVTGTIVSTGGRTTVGAFVSFKTSSAQGAEGSVPNVAPVQRRATRSPSPAGAWANAWPQAKSNPTDTTRPQTASKRLRFMQRFYELPRRSLLGNARICDYVWQRTERTWCPSDNARAPNPQKSNPKELQA